MNTSSLDKKEIIETVGMMFFKDKRLLINKPRLRPTYQIVGGSIEKDETPIEAIIREVGEELGTKAIYDTSKFRFVMDFIEVNTAFPDKQIHMHLFIYDGILKGELSLSEEIENFKWFSVNDDFSILADALRNEIIPYAIKNNLM